MRTINTVMGLQLAFNEISIAYPENTIIVLSTFSHVEFGVQQFLFRNGKTESLKTRSNWNCHKLLMFALSNEGSGVMFRASMPAIYSGWNMPTYANHICQFAWPAFFPAMIMIRLLAHYIHADINLKRLLSMCDLTITDIAKIKLTPLKIWLAECSCCS